MAAPAPRISVAWCSPFEPPPGADRGPGARFEVRPGEAGQLVEPGIQLAVIDSAAFDSLPELREAYRHVTVPSLVLIDAAETEEVLTWVRPSDSVCLRETPAELVFHLLTQLFRRRALLSDDLTGLAHRRQLLARLEQLLPLASEAHPVSLMVVNIDNFKALNDRHGHLVGDRVLQQVAALTSRCCQTTELVARAAGDELATIFIADELTARALAEDLRRLVEAEPFAQDSKVTVSAGLCTADEALGAELLLQRAHEALYAAKARGRNRVESYLDMEREALEQGEDLALSSFENLTRVVSDQIASTIIRRGRQLFEQLKEQADVDALTQLYSRRYLDRRLEREFEATRKSGSPLTVAMIDLDHFGRVNKRFGWPSGDRVLAEAAELVRSLVRATDWVGRYGGEEICLVMPHTRVEQGAAVLERLRLAVAQHPFVSTADDPISLTISVGATESAPGDKNLEALLERVSCQLLSAKRGGRDRVCVA